MENTVLSPFARTLLFGYVAQFVYEGDSPLAERRAAALSLDQGLLAELLGRAELRELLDPEVLVEVEAELQRTHPERRARDVEGVADLVRLLGPISTAEVAERSVPDADVSGWLDALVEQRRVVGLRMAGEARWAAIEDIGRLRDGLGVPVPPGTPDAFLDPVDDPLADLVARYARSHAPFTVDDVAARLALGAAVVRHTLQRLAGQGRVVDGEFRPGGSGTEWCDVEVLRKLRRRSLARLRKEVEPVEPEALGRFLIAWQHVGATKGAPRGLDGVIAVVDQLAGCPVPASALESLVLAARVRDYEPSFLDELCASGEVVWAGQGALPGADGWVSLHLADQAHLTLPLPGGPLGDKAGPADPADTAGKRGARDRGDPDDPATQVGRAARRAALLAETPASLGPVHEAVLAALEPGGAWFFRQLADAVARSTGATVTDAALSAALWDLVWSSRVSNDTLAPLRAMTRGGKAAHRTRRPPPRVRMSSTTGAGRRMPARTGPPDTAGRWALLPEVETDPTRRSKAAAERLLDRHGVVTRGAVQSERVSGGFAAVYKVLSAFEDSGRCRRGYFVDGLGAAQFGSAGAVDRLRTFTDLPPDAAPVAVTLAATDPANPYGAALPWPTAEDQGHRPGRKAGALVVLVDGRLTLYLERGGRTLLTWTDDDDQLAAATGSLAAAAHRGSLGRLTVEKADGEQLLGSGETPLRLALQSAGFVSTPKGLRLRA